MFQKASTAIMAIVVIASVLPKLATAQAKEHKQTLRIYYPGGLVLSGKAETAIKYAGPVRVEVFPMDSKSGAEPLLLEEIRPLGNDYQYQLPLGRYEVHFSMREADELRTTIKPIVLRPDNSSRMEVDFSPAKTLSYG